MWLIASALGAAYALTFLQPGFILGYNSFWTAPYGDRITNMIGALYFIHDHWRFPLFYVPILAIPKGANVIFTDCLPLLALAMKILHKTFGIQFNYFGLWLFACFPLLGLFTALAIKEAGVKDKVAIFGGVLLALASPAFLFRFGHIALMGQFLIVWSIYLYLKLINTPQSRSAIFQFCIVAALAILVQAYFLAMTVPFLFAALAQTLVERRLSISRVAFSAALITGVSGGIAWLSGLIGPNTASAAMWGFGYYSMNLISPFIPPHQHLPEFIARHIHWGGNGYTWDATGGQYEGYNYLGAGVLVLIPIVLFLIRRAKASTVRRHAFILLVLFGLLLYAASDRIFLGNWLILQIRPFWPLSIFVDTFRTGGRLFWPIYYVIVIALITGISTRSPLRYARLLIFGAVALQLASTQFLRTNIAATTAHGYPQQLLKQPWTILLSDHRFLMQFPSFQCGGWAGKWPDNNSNMELLLLAAKLNMPTNSAYLGRPNRNCSEEQAEGKAFGIRAKGLYIYGNTFPIDTLENAPQFKELCREFKNGIVCSRNSVALKKATAKGILQPITRSWYPAYSLGTLLKFSSGGDGKRYLGNGWSITKSWGTWSLGSSSGILLRLTSGLGDDLRLKVHADAFVHKGRPTKTFAVIVNGKQVAEWKYNAGDGIKEYVAEIGKALIPPSGALRIKFVPSFVKSPKSAGVSSDARELSFGLIDLSLSSLPGS